MHLPPDRHTDIFCLHCGYSLRGLDRSRCPECGLPFDLQDAATFTIKPITRLARYLARAPGRDSHLLTLICALAYVIYATVPGGWHRYRDNLMAAWIVWISLRTTHLLLYYLYLRPRYFLPPGPIKSRRLWLFAPAVLLPVFILCQTTLPFRAAFAISRPAMERLAKSPEIKGGRGVVDRWAGLFHFEDIASRVRSKYPELPDDPNRITFYVLTLDASMYHQEFESIWRPEEDPVTGFWWDVEWGDLIDAVQLKDHWYISPDPAEDDSD